MLKEDGVVSAASHFNGCRKNCDARCTQSRRMLAGREVAAGEKVMAQKNSPGRSVVEQPNHPGLNMGEVRSWVGSEVTQRRCYSAASLLYGNGGDFFFRTPGDELIIERIDGGGAGGGWRGGEAGLFQAGGLVFEELAVVGDSAPPLQVRPIAADGLQAAVDGAATRARAETGAAGDGSEGGQLFGFLEFPEDGGYVLGSGGSDGHMFLIAGGWRLWMGERRWCQGSAVAASRRVGRPLDRL